MFGKIFPRIDCFFITLIICSLGIWLEWQGVRISVIGGGDILGALNVFFFVWGGWVFFASAVYCWLRTNSAFYVFSMYWVAVVSFGIGDGLVSFSSFELRHVFGGIAHAALIYLPSLIFVVASMLLISVMKNRS